MTIGTPEGMARVRARLRQRTPEALVEFVMSLAQASGPLGDQARRFIVGDDVAETVKSVADRIARLSVPTEYEHRHAHGQEVGQQLALIVESIASLVLPGNQKAAFELLVALFQRDGEAMEQCGDHHWDVEVAYRQAAQLLANAAKSLPAAEVAEALRGLMANDGYGLRRSLNGISVNATT